MSCLDVIKVFNHSAEVHAVTQQQHERCSVYLVLSAALQNDTVSKIISSLWNKQITD